MAEQYRVCKVCQKELPLSSFRTHKYTLASGEKRICYAHQCIACKYNKSRLDIEKVRRYDAEWKRNWRKDNKEKVHKINQNMYAKNKEKYLAQKHEYYLKNKERRAEYNRNYLRSESGRERNREGGSRYEARKYGATIEEVHRDVVYKRDKGICYLCGKRVDKKSWQLEHVIPLSRGGSHSYSNVAVSHPICNQMKRAKTPEEYRKWLENLKK